MNILPFGNNTLCVVRSFLAKLFVVALVVFMTTNSSTACSGPTSSFPIYEPVDGFLANWTQGTSDDFDWAFDINTTPSLNTGPTAPYQGSHYAYIEGSGDNNPSKVSDLISPCLLFSEGNYSNISFAYHMYGSAIASLSLDVSTNDGSSWTSLWSLSGEQGDLWTKTTVDLSAYNNQNIKLRFRGTTGSGTEGHLSDIAIDDVKINSTPFSDCEEGSDINLYYKGLVNIPTTLEITETDNLDSVKVEVVYKGGNPGPTTTLTDAEGNVYTADRVSVGALNAYVYLFDLPATASVTYSNTASENSAQSIVAYGYRSNQPGKQFTSQLTILGAYNSTEYLYFDIPPRTSTQDMILRLPISEVTYDNRELTFNLTGGSVTTSVTKVWGPAGDGFQNECCIDVVDLILEDVPPSVNELELEIISPGGSGQSYVLAGVLTVKVDCYPEEICDDEVDNDNDGLTDCEDLDCGEILNRQFDEGTNNWQLNTHSGSAGNFSIDNTNKLSGANSAFIDISNATSTDWHVQLVPTNPFDLTNGTVYQINFDARAETSKEIEVMVQLGESPYTTYFIETVSLTDNPQSFQFLFSAEATTPNARLRFNVGSDETNLWIDNVQFKEACGEIECYAIAVSSHGQLYGWDGSSNFLIGQLTTNESNVEAMAMNFDGTIIYAIDAGDFGTVDRNTGAFTATSTLGYADGANGSILMNDVDAMAINPNNGLMMAVHRVDSGEDLLFVINPLNGTIEKNYFGPGIDYRVILGAQVDIDDIAYHPTSDELYAISTVSGSTDVLDQVVILDQITGSATVISDLPTCDIEGVTFDNNGNLFGSTGYEDCENNLSNSIYAIDYQNPTGTVSYLSTLGHSDVEALVCYVEAVEPCVNIDDPGLIAADQSVCVGGTPAPLTSIAAASGNAPNGIQYQWYYNTTTCDIPLDQDPNWILIPGATNDTYSPGPIYETTCFVRGVRDGGCPDYLKFSNIVTISTTVCCDNFQASIDYNGSVCYYDGATLTAIPASGTSPYEYNWSGPNSFSKTTQTVSITEDGNYSVTITDTNGCIAITNGFVYQSFEPFIVNLQTQVCEGDDVDLSVNGSGIQSIQWSANAGGGTSANTNVIPTPPSSTYYVTVTNNQGCTAVANALIDVDEAPDVSITGANEICVNETTTLSPTSGGVWISLNSSIASVSSTGVVTGNSAGAASFVFTSDATGCESLDPITVNVVNGPTVVYTGPSDLCLGESSSLSPTNGTWTSSNPSVATVTNLGIIEAVAPGQAVFTFVSSGTGCTATTSTPITVNGKPVIVVPANQEICIDETYSVAPSTGGTWESLNPSVATISNSGIITGVSAGTATFRFTSTATGCVSDESNPITVLPRPTVQITGGNSLCIGEMTTLTASESGTWSSEDSSKATITNAGVVTALAPGIVRLVFTSTATGCVSDFSDPVTIKASPVVSNTGNTNLCITETTTLTSTQAGTWVSNNPSVASINNSGLVTAIAAGVANFTFTSSSTNCTATSSNILVNSTPVTSLDGPSSICIGALTNVLPSTGGTWTSSNNSIATVSTSGIVTGLAAGTVLLTYTSTTTGCGNGDALEVTIAEKPTVTIEGDDQICTGETTTLSPSTGGTWTSNNPAVAIVSSAGVVTGVTQGVARFTFTNDANCSSNPTDPIVIFGKPTIIINGPTETCVGSTLSIEPSTGGTWQSSDPSVATIDNAGVITGIAPGTVSFTFTDTNSQCSSDESDVFTVYNDPTVGNTGDANLCIGETTNLVPSTGGLWTSSNPSVAIVGNDGLVVAVSAGSADFEFTDYTTGCSTQYESSITVEEEIEINYSGDTELCVGETTTMTVSTAGTWTAVNPSIATISSDGTINAVSQGVARFYFASSVTGCQSPLSAPLVVNGSPTVGFVDTDFICIGGEVQLYPNSGGTWTSSNTSIATVTSTGTVTGVAAGAVFFTFTDSSTGCSSDGTLQGTVLEPTVVDITGNSLICIGGHTTLSPNVGGVWISSNDQIATVTNGGVVKGISPGVVTFEFIDGVTGCAIGSVTDPVEIEKCHSDDFNVTTTDIILVSDISTNDNMPSGSSYGVPSVVEKPSGSSPILTLSSDGSYTFSSTVPGKYIYAVGVCTVPSLYGCSKSILEITVLDNVFSNSNPAANLDIASTYQDLPINLSSYANDNCVRTSGCSVNHGLTSISRLPSHGTATITSNSDILYTPETGFTGLDTIDYTICSGDTTNCVTSQQIITVMDNSASNSTFAADDFVWGMRGNALSGNVQINDGDAEGDDINVQAQGSSSSPITLPEGTFYIDALGDFVFQPNENFSGYAEIPYTSCDAQGFCTNATIHMLIFDDLTLHMKVYLEGALMDNGNAKSSANHPLMRADLRVNPFDGKNYIPLTDPYTVPAGVTDITIHYNHIGPGTYSKYQSITDSTTVFSVSGDDAIVDWVFVELRDKSNMLNTIATRSGLVQRDGDVVDLDGVSGLRFESVNVDSFYVVIKHRNHLGAMSGLVSNGTAVDFTDLATSTFNYGSDNSLGVDYTGMTFNTQIKPGYAALWAGDFDSNGTVKYDNPNDDQNLLFFEILTHPGNPQGNSNYDFAYGYYNGDYNLNGKAKYDNPNDDLNMIFAQVLLYQLNLTSLSNYSFFKEQVPR